MQWVHDTVFFFQDFDSWNIPDVVGGGISGPWQLQKHSSSHDVSSVVCLPNNTRGLEACTQCS